MRPGNGDAEEYRRASASKQKTDTVVKNEIDEMFDHYMAGTPDMPYIEVFFVVFINIISFGKFLIFEFK